MCRLLSGVGQGSVPVGCYLRGSCQCFPAGGCWLKASIQADTDRLHPPRSPNIIRYRLMMIEPLGQRPMIRGGFRQSQRLSGQRVMDILSKSSSCLRRSFLYSSISNVRREDNISGNCFEQKSADECSGFKKKKKLLKRRIIIKQQLHLGCRPHVPCRIQHTTNYKRKPEHFGCQSLKTWICLLLLTSLNDFVSITPPQKKSLCRPLILHIFGRYNKHKLLQQHHWYLFFRCF